MPTMTPWLKDNASVILRWAALIAASFIIFAASRGTHGLLTASVTLLIAIGLFEIIWQLLMRWIDGGGKTKDAW